MGYSGTESLNGGHFHCVLSRFTAKTAVLLDYPEPAGAASEGIGEDCDRAFVPLAQELRKKTVSKRYIARESLPVLWKYARRDRYARPGRSE